MSASRFRALQPITRQLASSRRTFAVSARQLEAKAPAKTTDAAPPVDQAPVPTEALQAPNRAEIWSRSQRPRSEAMTGPRFEQTDFSAQPAPYSAMELVHKQPVQWTHKRVVECNGGGGPTGHPKIFINTDKPEIAVCGYCGTPYAHEHSRKHLESLPATSYPL